MITEAQALEQDARITLMNLRVAHQKLRMLAEAADPGKRRIIREMVVDSGKLVNKMEELLRA